MDYKTAFKKGIPKGEFSKCKDQTFDPENLTLFEAAVLQGYDDAKRTFTKIGRFWEEHPAFRKNFFEKIAQEMQEIFKNFPADGFDAWHEKTCDLFRNLLIRKGYANVTYGQAQKVINMAFKYLYCLDGAETHNKVFDSCHMPLDSFTLTWYKRYDLWQKGDEPQAKVNEQVKWSSMKKETYLAVAKVIKTRLEEGQCFGLKGECCPLPKEPLHTEFIVWPEIQRHLAAEAFLFSLTESITRGEKKKICKESLAAKLEMIEEKLSNWK